MTKEFGAGRNAQLVLELASGTAILEGVEKELPYREFRLLAELARRAGDAVPSPELIQAVWPDEPWTPKENLYILVTRLRRLIDGDNKFGKNIRNRRGFGYMLDLEPNEVMILENAAQRASDIHVPEPESTAPELEEPDENSDREAGAVVLKEHPPAAPLGRPLFRSPRAATIAAALALLVGVSWSAGYALSSLAPSDRPQPGAEAALMEGDPSPSPSASVSRAPRDERRRDNVGRSRTSNKAARKKRGRTQDQPAVVAAAAPATSAAGSPIAARSNTSRSQAPSRSAGTSDKSQPPPAPALPPAPTRYLYHLINQKTGDHFVTTDGNTASEYEAMGFVGGPIARVYTTVEKDTKAISTNHGTAFIFISPSPRTEPSSRALPLWYSTDGSGDFFYTTNEAEASANGWQARIVGYVRSL